MPRIGILPSFPMQIGSRALGAPKEWMVVDKFSCFGVFAVALRFRTEGPNHLGMAPDTALSDVDVAPKQFERSIRFDGGDGGDIFFHEPHGNDFDQAPNNYGYDG